MPDVITSEEPRRDVSATLRAAETGPVTITEYGRRSHVLLTAAEYDRLSRAHELLGDRIWARGTRGKRRGSYATSAMARVQMCAIGAKTSRALPALPSPVSVRCPFRKQTLLRPVREQPPPHSTLRKQTLIPSVGS